MELQARLHAMSPNDYYSLLEEIKEEQLAEERARKRAAKESKKKGELAIDQACEFP